VGQVGNLSHRFSLFQGVIKDDLNDSFTSLINPGHQNHKPALTCFRPRVARDWKTSHEIFNGLNFVGYAAIFNPAMNLALWTVVMMSLLGSNAEGCW